MTLTFSDRKHPERSAWPDFRHLVLDRLASLPGVTDAGGIGYPPRRRIGDAASGRADPVELRRIL